MNPSLRRLNADTKVNSRTKKSAYVLSKRNGRLILSASKRIRCRIIKRSSGKKP